MPQELQETDINIIGNENSSKRKKKKFDWENYVFTYRYPILLLLLGLIMLGAGVIYYRIDGSVDNDIEIIENTPAEERAAEIIVEIAGAVQKPGVYQLEGNSRIEDLLISSGGFSADADRDWIARYINRAAKLADGQKIFIPKVGQQSNVLNANNLEGSKVYQTGQGSVGEELVNINTASQKQLEDLPGIGPVYAQSIIEHRPYSDVPELLSKGAIKQGVYDKMKDLVTVY